MKSSFPPIVPSIGSFIGQVFIIAYKENTDLLEKTFKKQCLEYQVIRQPALNQTDQGYSPSYLCLLNHKRAWHKIVTLDKPCLVI